MFRFTIKISFNLVNNTREHKSIIKRLYLKCWTTSPVVNSKVAGNLSLWVTVFKDLLVRLTQI